MVCYGVLATNLGLHSAKTSNSAPRARQNSRSWLDEGPQRSKFKLSAKLIEEIVPSKSFMAGGRMEMDIG